MSLLRAGFQQAVGLWQVGRRFDLVDLRLFAAIAEAGSISKGVERVPIALASARARVSGMKAARGARLLADALARQAAVTG